MNRHQINRHGMNRHDPCEAMIVSRTDAFRRMFEITVCEAAHHVLD